MSDFTTPFKAWQEDVQRRGKTTETENEIKEMEQCLKEITIQKLKHDIVTQQNENENLRKRLKDTRQNYDDDSEISVSQKYENNRSAVRSRALGAGNDPAVLNDKLKEVFSFCLRSALQQFTDLKDIEHPNKQVGKPENITQHSKTTEYVKQLQEMKKHHPDIAILQRLTASQSLANVRNTFFSEHPSDPENITEYIDSCLNLCWDMCSSNPVTYFIWEEDNEKSLFHVDDSDGKDNLKVVWPALVQICDKKYKKLVRGLMQSKDDEENSTCNKNTDNRSKTPKSTITQDSSAAVSTAETTVHVPGRHVSTSETTPQDKRKETPNKTNRKQSNISTEQKTVKNVSTISVQKHSAGTKGASKSNPSTGQKSNKGSNK